MKKAYHKAFKQINNFLENNNMENEPKAMYYMDSSALGILNTANSIAQSKNVYPEDITAVDIMRYYHDLSDSISASLNSALDKYVQYTVNSDGMRNRDRENLKKEISIELATFLETARDFLDSCGALEHSKIQHNVKMSKLNLSPLSVDMDTLKKEFDFTKNSHLDLPTLTTKCAFWANKAAKYVENIKLGILLFENQDLDYTKSNYKAIDDREKITAILKEQILTKFKHDITDQLPEDYSFNALLVLYSSVLQYQETEDEEKSAEILQDLPEIEPDIAMSLLGQMDEFRMEYDKAFSKDKDYSAFSKDMYCIGNNFALEDDLYNYKNMLMLLVGCQLVEQHSLPAPTIPHFGNSYDNHLKRNVLNIDLPNYFMPASFHYTQDLLTNPNFIKFLDRLPEYKGFFKGSSNKESLSTHVLFTPSAEQKKYIKEEFRKAKSHPDSYRTKLLSQMNGMANGRWQEFDSLMNKEQQH